MDGNIGEIVTLSSAPSPSILTGLALAHFGGSTGLSTVNRRRDKTLTLDLKSSHCYVASLKQKRQRTLSPSPADPARGVVARAR